MAVHLDSDSLVSTKHQEKQQRCTQVTWVIQQPRETPQQKLVTPWWTWAQQVPPLQTLPPLRQQTRWKQVLLQQEVERMEAWICMWRVGDWVQTQIQVFTKAMGGVMDASDSDDEWRCRGPDDAGWKEVTGKQVNKLNTNKPTTGYLPHSKNEFQALSTSIDYNPDLSWKFRQNSGRNFDSLPDSSFFGAGMLRLRFRCSASFWMTHFHTSVNLNGPPLQRRPNMIAEGLCIVFEPSPREADIKEV
jgi:hypothetical protein